MQDAAIYKLSIFHPKPQVHNSLFAVFDGHGSISFDIQPTMSVCFFVNCLCQHWQVL